MPKRSALIKIFVAGAAFLTVVIPLVSHEHVRGGDSWGAWFFARQIWETGAFPNNGRNPVYTLFLTLFWPLGYPLGPAVVRIFDALFLASGLFVLFRCYLGFGWSIFAALIWLPGLMHIESIVTAHVVSALCWAVAMRLGVQTRARFAYSYAFLLLAAMLRINYIPLLFITALYDLFRKFRASGGSGLLQAVKPKRCDLAIGFLVCLFLVFSTNQSEHRWNNAQYTDIQWFGPDQGSLTTAALVGSFAHWIIVKKHDGDFDNHDIYFIARDDMPGVTSMWQLYKYPEELFGQIYSNKQIISIAARITDLGEALYEAAVLAGSHTLSYPLFYLVLIFGLYRFYVDRVGAQDKRGFFEFFAAAGILTVPLLIAWPSSTYLYHLVPIFVFAGAGVGGWLESKLAVRSQWVAIVITAISIITLSNFASRSAPIMAAALDSDSWQRPHLVNEIFEGNFAEIEALTSDCRGIMLSKSYTAMAAFSQKPAGNFFSIFEIPPFGALGNPVYDGLRPDRIDCAIVHQAEVQRGLMTFTTKWSRYENYIVPYLDKLQKMGAKTYEFGADGNIEVTVLHPPQEPL